MARLDALHNGKSCLESGFALFSALIARSDAGSGIFAHEAVDREYQHGACGGDGDAFEVEGAGDIADAEELGADDAADEGSDDAKEDGLDETAAVFAWHDEFAKRAGHEAEDDPGDDADLFHRSARL
jgi:hypothetical protein